jgi:hypothetical protein
MVRQPIGITDGAASIKSDNVERILANIVGGAPFATRPTQHYPRVGQQRGRAIPVPAMSAVFC